MAQSGNLLQRLKRVRAAAAAARDPTAGLSPRSMGNQELDWGKHSGRTFRDVYEQEAGYVAWACGHLSHPTPSQQCFLTYIESRVADEEAKAQDSANPATPSTSARPPPSTEARRNPGEDAVLARRLQNIEDGITSLDAAVRLLVSLLTSA